MPPFTVNPHRSDPYKDFKFRVKWEGRHVAGISRVSPLKRTTDVVRHREGGDPSADRRSPGRTEFAPIRLERGITHDPAFEEWANKVWRLGAGLGSEVSLRDFRRDVVLELLNEAGQVVMAYNIYRCWVSEYQALPELDANGKPSVALRAITLVHEGFERDREVTEPTEPSLDAGDG